MSKHKDNIALADSICLIVALIILIILISAGGFAAYQIISGLLDAWFGG